MDAATEAIILELQLQDVKELERKTAYEADLSIDLETALSTYNNEITTRQTVLSDHRLARSLHHAGVQDQAILQEERRREAQAVNDRQLALRMGGVQKTQPQQPLEAPNALLHPRSAPQNSLSEEASSASRSPSSLSVVNSGSSTPNTFVSTEPHTSMKRARSLSPISNSSNPPKRVREEVPGNFQEQDATKSLKRAREDSPVPEEIVCTACTETTTVDQGARINCGKSHAFCRGCIQQVFQAASIDERSWPPKCCSGPIGIEDVSSLLEPTFREFYKDKSLEFSTGDRTYCHKPMCSAFISPATVIERKATCPSCKEDTCASCKEAFHSGPCNPSTDECLVQLAKDEGWQSCPKCKRIVDLTRGCYHMT